MTLITFWYVLFVSALTYEKQDSKWELAWEDNFTSKNLDLESWTIIEGDGCPNLCGFGNNELQYYTSDVENLVIDNGILKITGDKRAKGRRDYTSAKLITKGKKDFKYGKLEIKAKLPSGRGTWPAIWMLPSLDRRMKWPDDGEIDIMEHVGFNMNRVFGTIHTGRYNHMKGNHKSDSILVNQADETFHVYGLEWNDQSLTWLVDDRPFHTLKKGKEDYQGWPFDQPFHLILNLAIGGNWGGSKGIDDNIWPQTFEIDYVRYYTRENP